MKPAVVQPCQLRTPDQGAPGENTAQYGSSGGGDIGPTRVIEAHGWRVELPSSTWFIGLRVTIRHALVYRPGRDLKKWQVGGTTGIDGSKSSFIALRIMSRNWGTV